MLREYIGRQAASWFAELAIKALTGLAGAAPEIVTLGVVFCAFGLMVTGDADRWFGRMGVIVGAGLALALLI